MVVILAGGLGTRMAEETEVRPKPMVEVGGLPILWHIMKHYARYGHPEFALALGYKGHIIKDYFRHYSHGDVTVDLGSGKVTALERPHEEWVVHLLDTGHATMTGGRLRRLRPVLGEQPFMVTYGDGVANVDLDALLAFHRQSRKLATITAVRPPARFGALELQGDQVVGFSEKSQASAGWINGGFMVLEPAVLERIPGDDCVLEADVLERLALEGQLAAFRHEGFWQCMDTLRDKRQLEALWATGAAPWRTW